MASSWLLDGWRSILEPSRAFLGLHAGSCWLMLGSGWLKVASSWLQDGSRSLYVGSSWPQDAQHGPQRPPKYPKMRPKWLQDELKIENFEVFGRKARKCVWSYYSNVFLLFGSWESINFDQFWEQNPMKFPSFSPSWVMYAPRSLTIDARWST